MDVSFCVSALRLTAAICVGCFYEPAVGENSPMESGPSNPLIVGQEAAGYRTDNPEPPFFAIEPTTVEVRSKMGSPVSEPENSQLSDVSQSPHTDRAVSQISNTAGRSRSLTETRPFRNVNYSVLTPEFAFTPDTNPPFLALRASDANVQTEDDEANPSGSPSDAAGSSNKLADNETPQDAVSRLSKPLNDIVNRPLSDIRVGAVFSPVTSSGETLPQPSNSVAMPGEGTMEIHHLAWPHNRSRPSRNLYPNRQNPLYFEDPNLERCGLSDGCLTEFTSIAHFATRIPLLPYMMATDHPHDLVRALPDCPTCCQFGPEAYLPKPTVKNVAVQAAATTGFIFLIP